MEGHCPLPSPPAEVWTCLGAHKINAVGDHCSIPICLNIAKTVMCTVALQQ